VTASAETPPTPISTSSGGNIKATLSPKTFTLTTTAQVERTYTVQATDLEQAQARLRTHLKDPDMLRDGVISYGKQVDATPQRIKTAAK
jgi:hypothetical protein